MNGAAGPRTLMGDTFDRSARKAMKDKRELRRCILSLRSGLDENRRALWDADIAAHILRMREYREADAVLTYVSYQSEADTRGLIGQAIADGKAVFVPRVSGREMEFWQIGALADLREGYRGIPEPEPKLSFTDWLNMRNVTAKTSCRVMMWMPGVVFDRKRHRIGYGGGFYDRYLARFATEREDGGEDVWAHATGQRLILFTAALAYGCQILDAIPCEAHDIRPDRIVTEGGIIR